MKYEDLSRMYWDINNAICVFNELELRNVDEDAIDRLEWCLSTIHEELREFECLTIFPENPY